MVIFSSMSECCGSTRKRRTLQVQTGPNWTQRDFDQRFCESLLVTSIESSGPRLDKSQMAEAVQEFLCRRIVYKVDDLTKL